MSSPPSPRDFNGLIAETWGAGALDRPDVMALLEPYREHVDYLMDDFDEENQSWRGYCGCIYGHGRGAYGGDGAIPYAVQDQVALLMQQPAPPVDKYDTLHVGALGEPTLTFAPVDRTGLLAMREAIDRAIAAPGEVQRFKATIGGAGYTMALSCAEDGGA